jgi:glycine/D-amino acid oxidase-like deaminating enzyme
MATRMAADVLIIGGGVVGSSVAYWLARSSRGARRIVCLERDSSYANRCDQSDAAHSARHADHVHLRVHAHV